MPSPHRPVTFGVDGPTDGTFYQGYVKLVTPTGRGRVGVTFRRTTTYPTSNEAWEAAERLYRAELRAWNRANGTP